MAIAHGWTDALPPPVLQGIARRQAKIAEDPAEDARNASRAASVVVKIVEQVMRQEDRDHGITGEDAVNVNVGVNVSATIQEAIRNETDYLDFLEQQSLAEYRQSVVVEPVASRK